MFQVFIDKKEVWRHRAKPEKSFVTLIGYFIEKKEDKRWRNKELIRVCNSRVRPVLDYGGPAWQPWISPSNLEVLERVNQKKLRILWEIVWFFHKMLSG